LTGAAVPGEHTYPNCLELYRTRSRRSRRLSESVIDMRRKSCAHCSFVRGADFIGSEAEQAHTVALKSGQMIGFRLTPELWCGVALCCISSRGGTCCWFRGAGAGSGSLGSSARGRSISNGFRRVGQLLVSNRSTRGWSIFYHSECRRQAHREP
jgi:hypothetical protein